MTVNELLDQYPLYVLILLATLFVVAVIQIVYWLSYSRVARHSHRRREAATQQAPPPPVSVVIIIADDTAYVREYLPLLLAQSHPEYEVIVVDDGSDEDFVSELQATALQYPHLRYTTIKADPIFRHSRKLALTVGIKAARYENIIFTDADAVPVSKHWLSLMARGFNGGSLVIGYTGIERLPGAANKIIRCQRLTTSVRYLSAAIAGRPYRGIYNNIGYTRSLFFDTNYTHLRMTLGEDDLFVQKATEGYDARHMTSVIISPQATVRQFQCGTGREALRWWRAERKYRAASTDRYKAGPRISAFAELLTRALTVMIAATLVVLWHPIVWIAALSLWGMREMVMLVSIKSIMKRLGENRLAWAYIIHDFAAPVGELLLWISRKLKPSRRVWI